MPDRRAKARLLARLDRVAGGNLGDWRPIVGADGLAELRDPYGPGFRIYFGFDAATIIVLLGGSTKRDQQRAISRAKLAWADYQERR